MYVCLCHGISDKKIIKLVQQQGVFDIRALRQVTPLGSQCGKCIRQAKVILDQTAAAQYRKVS